MSEVDLAGNIVYQLQVNSDAYRTYRMPNLYNPTVFETGVGMPGGLATNQAFDFTGISPGPGRAAVQRQRRALRQPGH